MTRFPASPLPQPEIDLNRAQERAREAVADMPWTMAAILLAVLALIRWAV